MSKNIDFNQIKNEIATIKKFLQKHKIEEVVMIIPQKGSAQLYPDPYLYRRKGGPDDLTEISFNYSKHTKQIIISDSVSETKEVK